MNNFISAIVISVLLCVGSLTCSGQQFSIYGGPIQPFYCESSSSLTRQSAILSGFLDTLVIRQTGIGTTTYRHDFEVETGFRLGLDMEWLLDEKVAIFSGLGLQVHKFRHGSEFVSFDFVPESTDTIAGGGPVIIFPSSTCDMYTNSPDDVQVSDFPNAYNFMHVHVPAGVEYRIANGLDIRMGGFMSFLARTRAHVESVGLETETVGSGTACRYVLNEQEYSSMSGVRLINYGLTAGMGYWFGSIGLQLDMTWYATNIFLRGGDQEFFQNGIQAQPLFLGLNLVYRLNAHTPEPMTAE